MPLFNSTCPVVEKEAHSNASLVQDGNVVLQQHQLGFILAGGFALIAIGVSGWIIRKHLIFYTNRKQQRSIVRILLLPPIYAVMSWLSYFDWPNALYFQLVRDMYDSVVIAAFFFLLLSYLGETPDDVRAVFREVTLKSWVFPFGSVKYRPSSGLHFLHICRWMIMQAR